MGRNTRTYNRWQGYTLADCNCVYCVYYPGKKKPCPLDVCCCAEERREAFLREFGWFGDALPGEETMPCRV